jgi:hypothetical protein
MPGLSERPFRLKGDINFSRHPSRLMRRQKGPTPQPLFVLYKPKLNYFLRPIKPHLQPIEESSLPKNGNDARRIAESGVERECPVIADFESHIREGGSDMSGTDPAVTVHALRIERQVQFSGHLQRKQAIVRSGVDERQKINKSIFVF